MRKVCVKMDEKILETLIRLEDKIDRIQYQLNENTKSIKEMNKSLLQVEEVTASNWSDIIKIKKSISQ